MHRLILVLFAATMTACGGPTHEISARGFSTSMKNDALSRTTAENRAIAELQGMLGHDGVSFTLKRAGAASLLEVKQDEAKATYERVEFSPLTGGWMAIAFAQRKPEVAEALAALPAVETSATVTAPLMEMAAKVAKNRALRQLIDQAAGEGDGVFAGTVTLVKVEYGFDTEEAKPESKTEPESETPEPEGDATGEAAEPAATDTEEAADTEAPGAAEDATADNTEGSAETDAEPAGDDTAPAEEEIPAPQNQVTVTISGVAQVERTGDASDDDKIAVARKSAIEHFRVGEWKDSAEVTSALLELTPQSLPFVLLKAAAQFHLDETGPATETLSLAIMEGGGPEAEPLTNAFTELSKTVGADNITHLATALEEQKVAAASAAKKSKKKKKKKKKRKK